MYLSPDSFLAQPPSRCSQTLSRYTSILHLLINRTAVLASGIQMFFSAPRCSVCFRVCFHLSLTRLVHACSHRRRVLDRVVGHEDKFRTPASLMDPRLTSVRLSEGAPSHTSARFCRATKAACPLLSQCIDHQLFRQRIVSQQIRLISRFPETRWPWRKLR